MTSTPAPRSSDPVSGSAAATLTDDLSAQPVSGITLGVTGLRPRWTLTAWGSIVEWGAEVAPLDWFVAADDRWHVPSQEPTVRQRRLEGTPVVETRVRIPDGDVVQRAWGVPERGGLVVVEFENESPLPIAVALTGPPVVTERPPAKVPIQGIELPDDAVVLPVGHHATVRVLLASRPGDGPSGPSDRGFPVVPPPLASVRGWTRVTEHASRLVLPDETLVEALTAARCDLLLDGPVDPENDPTGFLLDVAELVRCGDDAEAWLPDVVLPAEEVAKGLRDGGDVDRREAIDSLRAARLVASRAQDETATADLDRILDDVARRASDATGSRRRRGLLGGRRRSADPSSGGPSAAGSPPPISFADLRRTTSVGRFVRSIERRIVDPASTADGSTADLLPGGVPTGWLGSNFEVHHVPSGPGSSVSFAVRWHGERPAVLWEQHGGNVTLTSPSIDADWSTSDDSGETLWAAPAAASPRRGSLSVVASSDDGPASGPGGPSGTGVGHVDPTPDAAGPDAAPAIRPPDLSGGTSDDGVSFS